MPTLAELRARFQPPTFEYPKYRVSANGMDALIESGAWCGVSVKYIASAPGGRAYLERILKDHAAVLDLCTIVEFYLKPIDSPPTIGQWVPLDPATGKPDFTIPAHEACEFNVEDHRCSHCDRQRMLSIEEIGAKTRFHIEDRCPAKAEQRAGRPLHLWKNGVPLDESRPK